MKLLQDGTRVALCTSEGELEVMADLSDLKREFPLAFHDLLSWCRGDEPKFSALDIGLFHGYGLLGADGSPTEMVKEILTTINIC